MAKGIGRKAIPELNESYLKVLYRFFSFPNKETSLNELSEELRISKETAKKIVLKLAKEGFLNRDIFGKVWRISCNLNHIYNTTKKVCYNLELIYKSEILKEIYKRIRNPVSIILFGSYRKGDDNEKSDIDIAVEILGMKNLHIEELGVLPAFGYRKNVPVNLYIFSRNKIDLNLFSNIANGILLEGFLEVSP